MKKIILFLTLFLTITTYSMNTPRTYQEVAEMLDKELAEINAEAERKKQGLAHLPPERLTQEFGKISQEAIEKIKIAGEKANRLQEQIASKRLQEIDDMYEIPLKILPYLCYGTCGILIVVALYNYWQKNKKEIVH